MTVTSFLTLTLDEAQKQVNALGLKISEVRHAYSDAAAGTVIEQSIAPTTVVESGTEIILTVSEGPDPAQTVDEATPPEEP